MSGPMLVSRPWMVIAGMALLSACGSGAGSDAAPSTSAARRGAPPPPAASGPAGACAGGGGRITDEVTAKIVPANTPGYCLDPNEPARIFGDGGRPLDDICNLFDGECDVYKAFRVVRVAQVRYVSASGGAATIDAYVSRFASVEDAYGMFTKRVVGDGDPADPATPKPFDASGAGALGVGNALVWRGAYLVELTLNDESAAADALKATGDKVLPVLGKAISQAITGDEALPEVARALPTEQRLPMGLRYVRGPLFPQAKGAADGAYGYYADGARRWRVAVIVRGDEAQAKEALSALAEVPGAKKEKGIGDGAVVFHVEEAPGLGADWVFARKGKTVIGVGDEIRVMVAGEAPDARAAKTIDRDAKIERLKKLVAP